MPKTCCAWFNVKHKKVFLIVGGFVLLAILVFLIAVASWKIHQERNGINVGYNSGGDFGRGKMMNRGKLNTVVTSSNTDNQFVLPPDASKSGEIAITVNNLEVAKKAISDIASTNNGNVYATLISYASNNVKNGSIVVQIPAGNFEQTFENLKKVGTQVVQEQTQQIPSKNIYAVPMMGATQGRVTPPTATNQSTPAVPLKTTTETDQTAPAVVSSNPEIAIYPGPIRQPQLTQNKGYIRVVFVDYGSVQNSGGIMMKRQNVSGDIIGVGNSATQEMRDNLLVIVGLKLIFLVAILGLLIVVFKRIFHGVRRRKENKKVVHAIKQMPKVHKRAVKVEQKKKK